jgi:hypothetical protein
MNDEHERRAEVAGGKDGSWVTGRQLAAAESLAKWSGRPISECAAALAEDRAGQLIAECRDRRGRWAVLNRLLWLNWKRIGWKIQSGE